MRRPGGRSPLKLRRPIMDNPSYTLICWAEPPLFGLRSGRRGGRARGFRRRRRLVGLGVFDVLLGRAEDAFELALQRLAGVLGLQILGGMADRVLTRQRRILRLADSVGDQRVAGGHDEYLAGRKLGELVQQARI